MRTMVLSCTLLAAGCGGFGTGSSSQAGQCPDSPATDVFDDTVCICEDFRDIGNLIVGRSVQQDEATLAVNGHSWVINNTQVRGTFVPYGGLEAEANVEVTGAIESAADVLALGNVEAGTDMNVGGDLGGAGRLEVADTLRIGGQDRFIGWREVASTGPYQSTPEPPCGCDDGEIFDVVAAVDEARNDNDNDAAGLPTSLRDIGWTELTLTSGSYYFEDIGTIGATRLTIDGAVAIYVDGNLDSIGAEWIELTDGSVLDLYVSGAVRTIGHVELGDPFAPSSFRLYIGGEEECTVNVGNQIFNGAIYAPRAELNYIGNTKIRGAVLAEEIHGIGNLVVGYAAPEPPPEECPPTDDPPDDDDDDDDGDDDDGEPPVVL